MADEKPLTTFGEEVDDLTPEMIEAGMEFVESTALGTVSSSVEGPQFVIDFYHAIRMGMRRGGSRLNALDKSTAS